MAFRGNRPKKKKKGKSLYYPYTDEDMKRVSWCMDRGIFVAVMPRGTNWIVEITLNKKVNIDPAVYDHGDAMEKMYEYYKYYYDKYRN